MPDEKMPAETRTRRFLAWLACRLFHAHPPHDKRRGLHCMACECADCLLDRYGILLPEGERR